MSIGVVSFAMVGILGLVPVGLSSFRSALNLTVEAEIVQGVAGEIQRTDYRKLAASNFYFDDQGAPVSGSNHSDHVYSVEVQAPQALDASGLVSPNAAKTIVLAVKNRTRPAETNLFSVIVPYTH